MALSEVSDAAKMVTSSAADDAKVIFGANIDESMTGSMRITVIATGFDDRRQNIQAVAEEQAPQSFFSANKYMPSNFMRKVQKDEEEEEKKFKQIIQSNNTPVQFRQPADKNQPAPVKDKGNAEDEMEIPAFIRKKMGI